MANPSQASIRSRIAKLHAAAWRGELSASDYAAESRKIDEAVLYLVTRRDGEALGAWRKRGSQLEHLHAAVESGALVGRPRALDDQQYALAALGRLLDNKPKRALAGQLELDV